MTKHHDLVDVDVIRHADTQKAVLVSLDGNENKAVWLPKSMIEIHWNIKDDCFVVTLPEQMAIDKGLV